jgi:hypothetical protein
MTIFVTTQVKDCIVTFFGPTETLLHGNIQIVLAVSKELISPREGPHHQFFRANRGQHVNSRGPPKESTNATSKIYFSLTN